MATEAPDSPRPTPPPARELWKQGSYRLFWTSRVCVMLGVQIQSVTLGWQMYLLARQTMAVKEAAFYVGMIGLAAFLPMLVLSPIAGEVADRRDRRKVMLVCLTGQAVTAVSLAAGAISGLATIPLLLALSALFGCCRAFTAPTSASLGPMLVPRALLPRAVALNSMAGRVGAILGPLAGGLLLAHSPGLGYVATIGLYLVAGVCVWRIRGRTKPDAQAGSRWELIREGLVYVWTNKIVFGAISLDLFAVLLGGATALLPVFARDVLHVGPSGFGLMRSAPSIGAILVALYLSARPIHRSAGLLMFGGVFVFGLATIVFGVSKSLQLSILALAVLGGADMLSVNVRQTLVQIVTPDHMRGRVAAVSTLFIGASNELGEFESGLVARLLGPVGAAVFGGVGALVVTGAWAKLFPDLRKADGLH